MRQELLNEISQAFEKTDQKLKAANKLFDEQQVVLSMYKSSPEKEKKVKNRLKNYLLKHQDKCEKLALKFRNNIEEEITRLDKLLEPLITHKNMLFSVLSNNPNSILYDSDDTIEYIVATPAWININIEAPYILVGNHSPEFMPSMLFFYVDIKKEVCCVSICNPDRLDIEYNSKTPWLKLAEFPLENYNIEEVHQIIVDYLTNDLAFLGEIQCPS
ncbi:hypothetical protein ORI89_16130 [Sphingobacterium sp. UT-1RO-CII-1]|uniref:hypothetical protein n=1 Tax=Sphingobacterium sp. UT-1RO-CII-1 TaxID=2995225 RepID=UPI00227BF014|nr:hypothetical protein [Sphingobacterium sp. UT-1RO-CII-1]MCY4781191.1 hypothetical protein [Sphingobacterium sp. UT-1RO-CII-1]